MEIFRVSEHDKEVLLRVVSARVHKASSYDEAREFLRSILRTQTGTIGERDVIPLIARKFNLSEQSVTL